MSPDRYQRWIELRRQTCPPDRFADRVMARVDKLTRTTVQRHSAIWNRPVVVAAVTRCVACCAALLIGSIPFLYVAYVAKLIAF